MQVGLGLSKSWNPRRAGEEAIVSALANLSKKPKFVLLFSTIHYKKKGLQKLVEAAYDTLSGDVPMVGGTVAGFINNFGVFTRGVTALATYDRDIDVSVSYARRLRWAPTVACERCFNGVKKILENSKPNKLLLFFLPTAIIPEFPFIGRKNIITSTLLGEICALLLHLLYLKGEGLSREDEVVNKLNRLIPKDVYALGCSLMDDGKFLANYQFYNGQLLTDSLIFLAISAEQLTFEINSTHGLIPTGIKFKVTKTKFGGKLIKSLDNESATKRFSDALKLSLANEKTGKLEFLYRSLYYYPLGFVKNNQYYPVSVGAFLGENIVLGAALPEDCEEVEILTITGKELVACATDVLKNVNDKTYASFIVSCAIRLNTLGNAIFRVYEKLLHSHKRKPFLLVYVAGEFAGIEHISRYNLSFNLLTFKS